MKTYSTSSDRGLVLIGNKDYVMEIPNHFGDGENTIKVYDSCDEFKKDNPDFMVSQDRKTHTSYGMIKGRFNIYRDDCCKGNEDDVLVTIHGSYEIFVSNRTGWYSEPEILLVPCWYHNSWNSLCEEENNDTVMSVLEKYFPNVKKNYLNQIEKEIRRIGK